jgi:hypothetical protein
MFPLNQPGPTAFYLSLYLGTLMLHVLPMAYVVAGSAVLLTRVVAQPRLFDDPLTIHLRQWLPFVLSAAITAGVAPLLFLQILYQREFYTANLLLFHRWMAILPVLIASFYLLYLVKGEWLWRRNLAWRALVVAMVFVCFAFVGWSWTENHLLSLARQEVWTAHYAAGRMMHFTAELAPRLGVWLGGVFPVMAALVAWPLASHSSNSGIARRLALIAIGGMLVSLACGGWYLAILDARARESVLSAPWRVWQAAIALGVILQALGWTVAWRSDTLSWLARFLTLFGAIATVAGVVACREAIRTSRIDLPSLFPRHAAAAEVNGFWLFATFFVLNAIAIAACVAVVKASGGRESPGNAAPAGGDH